MHYELADTLTHLIESVAVTPPPGIVVTRAEIDFPLEVSAYTTQRGRLVFFGSPPHSRWKTGVLPEVHMARLRVEIEEA